MDRARSNHSAKKNRTGGEERRGGQRKAEERREYRSKPCWMSWAEGNLGRDWRQRHACPTCQVIVSSSYLGENPQKITPVEYRKSTQQKSEILHRFSSRTSAVICCVSSAYLRSDLCCNLHPLITDQRTCSPANYTVRFIAVLLGSCARHS